MEDVKQQTYLDIMTDSLDKKYGLLTKIEAETRQQEQILGKEELDIDSFNECILRKDELLKQLAGLDEGFLKLYTGLKASLEALSRDYPEKIKNLQYQIKRETELTTSLMALEERNKSRLSLQLSKSRQKMKDFKVSSKTAAAYYKNMTNKHRDGDSYFMDKKK